MSNPPYRNLGTYSSLGDSNNRPNAQNQNNSNQLPTYGSLGERPPPNYSNNLNSIIQPPPPPATNNYSSLGQEHHVQAWANGTQNSTDHSTYRRDSNYSTSSNSGANAYRGEQLHQQQQQPLWIMEQQQNNILYGGGQNSGSASQIPVAWNIERPNNQHQNQSFHSQQTMQHPNSSQVGGRQQSYAQLGQPSLSQQQFQRQLPNQFTNSAGYAFAIPPPPPPPPPLVPPAVPPSKATVPRPKSSTAARQSKSSVQKSNKPPSATQSKASKPKRKNKQPPPEPKQSKRQRERDDSTKQKESLRWQPPRSKHNDDEKPPAKLQSHRETNATQKIENSSAQHASTQKSAPLEPLTQGINESVDANVSAISALSALETKWTAPPSKPLNTRQKRRSRNRERKKRSKKQKDASSHSVYDAVELIGEWVDMANPNAKNKGESNLSSGNGSKQEVIDLTGDESDFPPLLSMSDQQHDSKSNNNAAVSVRDFTDMSMSLDEMSQAQLSSYASVLSRAIHENKVNVSDESQEPPKTSQLMKSDSTSGDEMDISDDEGGNNNMKQPAACMSDKVNDTSSNASNSDSNQSYNLDVSEEEKTRLRSEKETVRLRLQELRAKAKLANAKLRLAKKKRALGTDEANDASQPPQNKAVLSSDSVNDIKRPGVSAMRMLRPLSDTIVPDLTAVRMLSHLVINVGLITEPRDKVRFVDSIYQDSSSDDESHADSDVSEEHHPLEESKPTPEDPESGKSASESLKQKIHLAKLRLELKKKKLAMKKQQSQTTVAAPLIEQNNSTLQYLDGNNQAEVAIGEVQSPTKEDDQVQSSANVDSNYNNANTSTSEEDKASQIEELRRRQKELKQSNEVSNLRNLVQRQREILRVKGKELRDSSTQLHSCVSEMKLKQEKLAASEKSLEEMNHRKRILEGMILRATDKLMTARRNLTERQTQEANEPDAQVKW